MLSSLMKKPNMMPRGVKVSISITMPSYTGVGRRMALSNRSIRQWSDGLSRGEVREARKYLRGAAAYCRTVMRRGFKKGSVKKKPSRFSGRNAQRGVTSTMRTRSKPPKAPHYHTKGRQWGIRTIVFTKLDPDTYAIGPKQFKSKGSKNSRFNIPEMLEFGGTGKVKTLSTDRTAEVQSVWSRITGNGGKYPTQWSSARYVARPYASITVKPTLKKFNRIYGR